MLKAIEGLLNYPTFVFILGAWTATVASLAGARIQHRCHLETMDKLWDQSNKMAQRQKDQKDA